ncbi:MAG TPA: DUF4956 domain-containing protein [Patescibacteria group bacterium]|nr:DUF4956 domain-containing protein [Patescibacteria group bacterium]
MFETLFQVTPNTGSLSLIHILITLVLSLILSLIIAWIYKTTHRGISYSQSFVFTLVLIGVLISVIMMIIGNSLAIAFGAFGAFSLIRFRTAIKDAKDIAFILLVVAMGLSVGTRNYLIAVLTTIFCASVIYILTKINFGSIRKYDYLLSFLADSQKFNVENLRSVFAEFLKYDNLLNVSAKENGRILNYTFNIKFIKAAEIEKFINKLNQLEGISDIDVISAKNDIEY